MEIDINPIVSVTEEKPERSPVTPVTELSDEEKIDIVAARILERFKPAFEELAK